MWFAFSQFLSASRRGMYKAISAKFTINSHKKKKYLYSSTLINRPAQFQSNQLLAANARHSDSYPYALIYFTHAIICRAHNSIFM